MAQLSIMVFANLAQTGKGHDFLCTPGTVYPEMKGLVITGANYAL
jgi:hypothetical protein